MSPPELRKMVHLYIDKADDKFLNAMYAMMQVYMDESTIVGHTASGKPISKKELKKRVKQAEARMDKGEFITQEDLDKEVELW